MRISRFDASLTEEDLIYPMIVKIWSGNQIAGEIEMETSCGAAARNRWEEQCVEVFLLRDFDCTEPILSNLKKAERIVYQYIKENATEAPLCADIKELALLAKIGRNCAQRAVKHLKSIGAIATHQRRGKKKEFYAKS